MSVPRCFLPQPSLPLTGVNPADKPRADADPPNRQDPARGAAPLARGAARLAAPRAVAPGRPGDLHPADPRARLGHRRARRAAAHGRRGRRRATTPPASRAERGRRARGRRGRRRPPAAARRARLPAAARDHRRPAAGALGARRPRASPRGRRSRWSAPATPRRSAAGWRRASPPTSAPPGSSSPRASPAASTPPRTRRRSPTGTIAVQAGGIDEVYPPENAGLAAEIAAQGLRLSEMPLGPPAAAAGLPAAQPHRLGPRPRRRGDRGRRALGQPDHRPQRARPGPRGDGGARQPARRPRRRLQRADPRRRHPGPLGRRRRRGAGRGARRAPRGARAGPRRRPRPPAAADGPLGARLLALLGAAAVAEDALTRDLAAPAAAVSAALVELELEGRVRRHPGGLVSLAGAAGPARVTPGRAAPRSRPAARRPSRHPTQSVARRSR